MNAIRDETEIRIYDSYLFKESIKEIPGRKYDSGDKCWVVPLTKENARLIQMLGAETDDEIKKIAGRRRRTKSSPLLPMLIKAKPYKHQIAAYNFALEIFGIADSKYKCGAK